jgi:hypothetical protein
VVRVVRHSGIDATAFSVFKEWCVYEHIAVEDTEDGEPDFKSLVQAYVLGVYLKHTAFCKAVLEACLEVIHETGVVPDASAIALAYDKSVEGSPLRALLVEMYVNAGEEELDIDALLKEFVKELFRAFSKRCRDGDWDLQGMKEAVAREEMFSEGEDTGSKVVVDSGAISPHIECARALLAFEDRYRIYW